MARTVAVQYVGPHDEVLVPAIGATVKRGQSLEVSADVAGVGPSEGDLGSGLLAQPSNWQPAPAGEEG